MCGPRILRLYLGNVIDLFIFLTDPITFDNALISFDIDPIIIGKSSDFIIQYFLCQKGSIIFFI